MKLVESPPFSPHRLFRGGHAQTVIAALTKPVGFPYTAVRHVVRLPDEDSIVLHDDRPAGWSAGNRVAVLVHGVAGCHGSPYIVRTAGKLNRRGVRTFRMDLRGSGAGSDIARRPGHAGRSEDVRAAVSRVADICPGSPVSLIGFSMGGNIVLKLLGEDRAGPHRALDGALAVAPPVDLARCSSGLERGVGRVYSRAFTRMLLRGVRRRRALIGRIALSPPPKTLWEFDDRITSRLSGFRDAADYYGQCSAARLLPDIQLPTSIVTARDDPLIPVGMFQPASLSASTSLSIIGGGGHVGFYAADGADPDRWWLDWRIVDWVGGC